MAEIRQGKRPVSQKRQRPAPINPNDIFRDPIGLDDELKATIVSKGYAYRFINYKQFVDMGGTNTHYWTPVKRSKLKEWGYDMIDGNEFTSGSDVDGYIRRGDLVLAVRPKAIQEKHKAYLAQENARVADLQGAHADELREIVRDSGGRIHEGYEDEEEK